MDDGDPLRLGEFSYLSNLAPTFLVKSHFLDTAPNTDACQAQVMDLCKEVGQRLIWITHGEISRRLGWEKSHGMAEVFGWSWC